MSDLVDFGSLNDGLLKDAERLLSEWLPDGRAQGNEYVCSGLGGGSGGSLSVNLTTGKWAEFNGTDSGGDLISLYAAIHGLNNGQAARRIMKEMGWEKAEAAPARPARPAAQAPPAVQTSGPGPSSPAKPEKRKSVWRAIVPVPDSVPAPSFHHFERGQPEATWEYRLEGRLYGYVCRFPTSDGGKEILPYTWCMDESDDRRLQKWTWKQWDEPRPLYMPATLLPRPDSLPVVVVEGEKCADAGMRLLAQEFDFVSWPGGGKACLKGDWERLRGCSVYLWADCDAKRYPLSKDERTAGVDPTTKEILPEPRQPGVRTMRSIGDLLMADFGCKVFWVPIPKPGDVADGWDIADAIAAGWTADQVRNRIRSATAYMGSDEARAKAAPTPSEAAAGDGDGAYDSRAWKAKLITSSTGAVKPARENVVLALTEIAEVKGVVAHNEFTNDVMKLRDAPWNSPAGLWEEVDELLMGEWLVRDHYLPSMPRGTLEEAIRMVAFRNRFHPVRAYLSGLTWDGTPRLRQWLRRVCLDDGDEVPSELDKYLARAGTWFVQGMCARVMRPGVKFDYMLILEGKQGRKKSAVFATLAGDYFSDTGLVMGEKDSYQGLQGRWLYEFAELDSFAKSEVTKIKAFVASASDYFRASFDKRARDYPRQVVFGGTTNEDTYLTDPTGNRRFWPVRVTRSQCDIAWLVEHRDQLFAEAMVRYRDGARMWPTQEEEVELFEPQQNERTVDNGIFESIARWLGEAEGGLVKEVSVVEMLGKVGIGLEKLGPGRHHEKQAGAALKRLGWVRARSSRPGRPWLYRRPEAPPPPAPSVYTAPAQGISTRPEEAPDAIPF